MTTLREVAIKLDLPWTSENQVRITKSLRALGWTVKAERLNGCKANAWRPSLQAEATA